MLPASEAPPPRPSAVRRCRNTSSLCRLLHLHCAAVDARFWCTALCHLSQLVDQGGEQLSAESWRLLRGCLLHLTQPPPPPQLPLEQAEQQPGQQQPGQQQPGQQQPGQQQPGQQQHEQQQQQERPAALPACSAQQQQLQRAPIAAFAARDVATLLWALAKLRARLPDACWPPLLQAAADRCADLSPRDMCLLAWSLARLAPPTPAGWFQQLLDAQAGALAAYPPRSLVVLLYGCARLRAAVPGAAAPGVLAALAGALPGMPARDLAMAVWSLAALRLRPPAAFMAAALRAARRHLPLASCAELSALLVGAARLRYLPPSRLLLELYDQLYWTTDQLQLRQLANLLWALGRLRTAAVPAELAERMLAFAQLQAAKQLAPAVGGSSGSSGGSSAGNRRSRAGSGGGEAQRHALAKQLHLLLVGLAGLRPKLSRQQVAQAAPEWLLAVVSTQGGSSRVRVPACLHACGLLEVSLPPEGCAAVLAELDRLSPQLGHTGRALSLWGAVAVGCRPDRAWRDSWLAASAPLLGLASMAEVNMQLHACVRSGGGPPPAEWLGPAFARLTEALPRADAHNLDACLRHLATLRVAGVPSSVLSAAGARLEVLEVAGQSPRAVGRAAKALVALRWLAVVAHDQATAANAAAV